MEYLQTLVYVQGKGLITGGYLVQVVGAGVHPLPQDVPLLPPEEPPERREAVDLQAVQPDTHTEEHVYQFIQYIINMHSRCTSETKGLRSREGEMKEIGWNAFRNKVSFNVKPL